MYRQSVSGRGKGITQRTGENRSKRNKTGRDQVRFRQLMICLMLFLTVFVGKGVFPQRVQEMSGVLLEHLEGNTDFRGALVRLGHALSEKNAVFGEIGTFCLEVFGEEESAVQVSLPVSVDVLSEKERWFLNSGPDSMTAAAHYLRLEEVPGEWLRYTEKMSVPQDSAEEMGEEQPEMEPMEQREEEPEVPAVGVIVLPAGPQEKEPPEGHTMDQLSLGGLETVTPVEGTMWSGYGYRDHPMDGGYKFHSGVDLGADTGAVIGAFAAGTVEYIGVSEAYGNYLQIDHGQGIKSFYAHCQGIDVQQGQQVGLGEPIARVGSTGSATGPHLHLELKCAGVRINPAYYIHYKTP